MLGCAAGVRSTGYMSEGVSLWNFLSSIADLQMYKLLQDLVFVCVCLCCQRASSYSRLASLLNRQLL